MRLRTLFLAALISFGGVVGARAQMTYPLQALEDARRGRIEQDARMKRESADQTRKERDRAAAERKADSTGDKALRPGPKPRP